MAGQSILAGANGLNFWTVLGTLKGAAHGVQFACSMRSLIVAAVAGDAGEFLLALSNGIVSLSLYNTLLLQHLYKYLQPYLCDPPH